MREKLKQIGLKSYEAMAYECLLKHGTLSGKEISKQTKIPHTKVYVTLNYLIEKGAKITDPPQDKRPQYQIAIALGSQSTLIFVLPDSVCGGDAFNQNKLFLILNELQ